MKWRRLRPILILLILLLVGGSVAYWWWQGQLERSQDGPIRAAASRYGVEMPISRQMFEMLHSRVSPREAIRQLMERSLKGE